MIEIDNTKKVNDVPPEVVAAIQAHIQEEKVYVLSQKQIVSFINNVFGINFYLSKQQTMRGENYERFFSLNAQSPSDNLSFEQKLDFAVKTSGKIDGSLELFLKHMCIKNILPEGNYLIKND